MDCLREQDLLDGIQLMIHRSYPQADASSASLSSSYTTSGQIALGLSSTRALSAPNNRIIWRKDPRMSVYRNREASQSVYATATADDNLKQFLRLIPGAWRHLPGLFYSLMRLGARCSNS